MDVKDAIDRRRAYRSLKSIEISDELIHDLAKSAGLSASCFNNQPWRFVFARNPTVLQKLHGALTRGNRWAKRASMIVAVFSSKEDDCIIKNREYHHFDTGMAVAFLILRATELGLVAHPIGGYNEDKVKEILGIPADIQVITLVNIGKKSKIINDLLSEDQKNTEITRPERLPIEKYAWIDKYQNFCSKKKIRE